MAMHDGTDGPRERQAAALSAAEKQSGKSKTKLAAELDMSYDQYARYANGKAALRYEQLDQFAAAYGVDPTTLSHAVVTGDTSELIWDLAGALRGHMPEDRIAECVEKYGKDSIQNQKAQADVLIRDYQEHVAENTLKPKRTRAS